MFKASINSIFNFDITKEQVEHLDCIPIQENEFHLVYKEQSYLVKVESINRNLNNATLRINGNTYDVNLEDNYDQLIKQLGLEKATSKKMTTLKASMPGLVLEILVEVGASVEEGDALLILEAMKMENIIKAQGAGVIKNIVAQKGKAVDKNELLIEFE